MIGTSCFLDVFFPKTEQNVRFQTNFLGKPDIIGRQFSQNVTVFYARYSLFFETVFGQTKNKTFDFQPIFRKRHL